MNEINVSSLDIIARILTIFIFSYILVIIIQNVRKSKSKKYSTDENLNIITHFLVVGASILSLYALLVILYEIIVNRIG
jgi:hypothetical protein